MTQFYLATDLNRIHADALTFGETITAPAQADDQKAYGGNFESYWWNLPGAREERERWVPLDGVQGAYPTLSPETYVPVELGLAVCWTLIQKEGFISRRHAARSADHPEGLSGAEPTCELAANVFLGLAQGLDWYDITPDLSPLKVGHEQLKKRATWWLETLVRTDGISEFTRRADRVLKHGEPDFHCFAFMAWHMLNDHAEEQRLRLPSHPLKLAPSKTIDIPGIFQVRKTRKFRSFYGDKVFYICANESNMGVCFSIAPEKHQELNLPEAALITLRAGVVGPDSTERYTRLERVQIKRKE